MAVTPALIVPAFWRSLRSPSLAAVFLGAFDARGVNAFRITKLQGNSGS
jgi:hypothetical protein